MGKALETLAQQSRIVPTIIFRDPETVTYGREQHIPVVMELGELPREDEDEDKLDHFL